MGEGCRGETPPQGPLSPGARQCGDSLQQRLTFAASLGTGPPEPGASRDNCLEPPGTYVGCMPPAPPPPALLATETRPLPCPCFVPPCLPSPAAHPPRGLLRPPLMYAAAVHCENWYSSAQLLRTYKLPRNFSGRKSSRGSGSWAGRGWRDTWTVGVWGRLQPESLTPSPREGSETVTLQPLGVPPLPPCSCGTCLEREMTGKRTDVLRL